MSVGRPQGMVPLRREDPSFQEVVNRNIPMAHISQKELNDVWVARIQDAKTGMVCFVEPDLLREIGTIKRTLTKEELRNLNKQPAWYTTFVFIRIPDQAEWTCHLFTPAIAEDIGLVVDAQEYTLESGGPYTKTKFKAIGDVYLWEAEGMYFKFEPKSRDLQLTYSAKKATHFKFSPPVTKSPALSLWIILFRIWEKEHLCNYQEVIYQRVPLLRDVENHKILVGGLSTFDEKMRLHYFNEGLKVGNTEHVTSTYPWDQTHFVFHHGGRPEDALSSMRIFTIATFKSFGLVVNEKNEVIFKETTTEDEVQKLTSIKLTAEYHLVTGDGKTGLYIDEEGIVKATLDKANWHHFRHTQFKCRAGV